MPEGVQNTGAEVSELQLMAENQRNAEATAEAADDSPPQTGGNVHNGSNLADVSTVPLTADVSHVVPLLQLPGKINFCSFRNWQ